MQRAMTLGAGVLRSEHSLEQTAKELDQVPADDPEVRNLLDRGQGAAGLGLGAGGERGSHTRSDFPETSEQFRVRMVLGGAT